MESPGCLFGIAIVALAVVVAVLGIRAAGRKRRAKRVGSLAEALIGSGFSTEVDAEIPAEAPDWEIAPKKKRDGQAIRIESGDATVFLFDHVQDNKGYLGWNEEVASGGDSGTTRTYRHTLACLHAPALALPSLQVIPNVRVKMHGIVGTATEDLEAEGHTKSAGALDMLMGLVGGLAAAHERPGALALADQEELMAAFKIYGDESAVAALLTGPVRTLLLSQPGTILDGRNEWMIVSLNVGMAFGIDRKSRLPQGLLSPEQTVQLVELTFALREALE